MTNQQHEVLEKGLSDLKDLLNGMICDLNKPFEMWFHRKSENMYRVISRSETVKIEGEWMPYGVVTYIRWDMSDLKVYSKFTHDFDREFSKIVHSN